MNVRRMLKQDISAVAELEQEGPDPWSETKIRTNYRGRHTSSWVVEKHNEVIGYAIVTSDWMVASILRFRVALKHQRAGAGFELLSVVVNAAGDDCSIEVAIDERESGAQVLFGRFGFACTNDTDTGYLFRKGTRFLFAPDLKYRMLGNGCN